MLNLSTWPAGMRVLIRREHPHPGAALSLFEDADGWRYQAVATNTPLASGGQVAFLEARHRAHARVETRIRHAKDIHDGNGCGGCDPAKDGSPDSEDGVGLRTGSV